MIYRKATSLDLPRLLQFGEQLYLVEKEFDSTVTFSHQEASNRYTRQFANPLAFFLIVEKDDHQPVGYLYAHIERNDINQAVKVICVIEVVFVALQFRGRRIGEKLLTSTFDWADEKGVTDFSADIFPQNVASIKLFTELGFKAIGTHQYTLHLPRHT